MKILIIGDTHFRDNLSYADYVEDRRIPERNEILNFIIDHSNDCDCVVFMGDFFNSKNNSSETNRLAVNFLERFNDKDIYIIAGNHEKKGDGKTAMDFLAEVKKRNWNIYTKPKSVTISYLDASSLDASKSMKIDFLPYMLNSELGTETCEESTKKIVESLTGGDILFAHHAISGTTFNGIKTDTLKEVVLPKEVLEQRYKKLIAGHIHQDQIVDNTLITGSLFTDYVGEVEKFIFKIDDQFNIEKIKVPAREIHKVENPTVAKLMSLPANSIVKAIITDKEIDIDTLKATLKRFDAHLLIEDYASERTKMHIEEGAMSFEIESLLKLYSESKDVDLPKLLKGLQLIQNA